MVTPVQLAAHWAKLYRQQKGEEVLDLLEITHREEKEDARFSTRTALKFLAQWFGWEVYQLNNVLYGFSQGDVQGLVRRFSTFVLDYGLNLPRNAVPAMFHARPSMMIGCISHPRNRGWLIEMLINARLPPGARPKGIPLCPQGKDVDSLIEATRSHMLHPQRQNMTLDQSVFVREDATPEQVASTTQEARVLFAAMNADAALLVRLGCSYAEAQSSFVGEVLPSILTRLVTSYISPTQLILAESCHITPALATNEEASKGALAVWSRSSNQCGFVPRIFVADNQILRPTDPNLAGELGPHHGTIQLKPVWCYETIKRRMVAPYPRIRNSTPETQIGHQYFVFVTTNSSAKLTSKLGSDLPAASPWQNTAASSSH